MLFTIIATIILIYILTLVSKAHGKLSPKITHIIRISFFTLAPVLITILILRNYDTYPRGYWFTKILFWTVFFLMMILFGVCNKTIVTKFERVIYGLVFYLPLLYIPVLFVPFIGIGMFLLFYTDFIGDNSKIVYADSNIRLEQKYIPLLGPAPPLVVYTKRGLFPTQILNCLLDTGRTMILYTLPDWTRLLIILNVIHTTIGRFQPA